MITVHEGLWRVGSIFNLFISILRDVLSMFNFLSVRLSVPRIPHSAHLSMPEARLIFGNLGLGWRKSRCPCAAPWFELIKIILFVSVRPSCGEHLDEEPERTQKPGSFRRPGTQPLNFLQERDTVGR